MKTTLSKLILIICVVVISACTQYGKVVNSQVQINTREAMTKPYVLLISLDGFRWDYVNRFKPPVLSQFIHNGVKAESLIPSFPSKTFPNHFSIATGMYPDKHNIVGNSFYDHNNQAMYTINNREAVGNGSFYAGTPIWVQAALSGMVTASYFFVGTEAKIQGFWPTSYYHYDSNVTHNTRVNQVLDWLALPEKTRPHLITLYFEDMDDTGHKYGPSNDEKLKKTLSKLDKTLGVLFKGIEDSSLPVNTIIVSDHGMMDVPVERYVPVEMFENNVLYKSIVNGSLINIHPNNANQTESIFQALKSMEMNNHFKVYKTENTPGFEYTPQNKNWGSIQVVVDYGYYFNRSKSIERREQREDSTFGQHGFDPINKEMHGIFYANGPAFKQGLSIPSFKNIHIYPLLCEILNLPISEKIDGNLKELHNILKN